ncbi:DUF1775 domain-containing protein [Microvirga tunisiensis]|uniref:DUF1775 domain-containing protein n=2 Tax=Pannonibacter tanglangensis TaxID=2750084 RepID=A0A7X5F505_9HYPH|nr:MULTISPECIES: DUF1775 domain-containing protein [unclassified Pannonibacter]NBN65127.1 DUF1775 domain-containing protein [Pannonibacter sp. XCT-34]NBN79895.1 DUF1775 domain-containing protein [Pannonibacter sp. XCT-53]
MKKSIIAAALLALSTAGASAHATFENKEVVQNTTVKMVLRVPHGCEGEATNVVRIQIPEGIIAVKPMPKAGWKLETVKGAYANTYENHGTKVTEGVKEIIWSGGELLDEHYDEFVFRGRFTDKLEADKVLYIPAVQECATKAERWIEIPAEGQDPDSLAMPAPGVKIIKGGKPAH